MHPQLTLCENKLASLEKLSDMRSVGIAFEEQRLSHDKEAKGLRQLLGADPGEVAIFNIS